MMKTSFFKNRNLFFSLLIGVFICNMTFFYCGFSFVFNTSDSLPGFLYLSRTVNQSSIEHLKKGDVIVFKHDLYKGKNILKKMSHQGGACFKAGPFWPTSPYHPNTKERVPLYHVAVQGEHLKSFDSRYEEFGFVSYQDIKGVAWPLF